MAIARSTTSCPECCTQDSEKYWRVTGYTATSINQGATCTTIPEIEIDDGCFFGTPLQVLISAVSGKITVLCPGCPPLPVGNCSGGTENYCGAKTVYSLPAIFSNATRFRYDELDFFGSVGTAIVSFEDCVNPLPPYDITFKFSMRRCAL